MIPYPGEFPPPCNDDTYRAWPWSAALVVLLIALLIVAL